MAESFSLDACWETIRMVKERIAVKKKDDKITRRKSLYLNFDQMVQQENFEKRNSKRQSQDIKLSNLKKRRNSIDYIENNYNDYLSQYMNPQSVCNNDKFLQSLIQIYVEEGVDNPLEYYEKLRSNSQKLNQIYHKIFSRFDADGGGTISLKEFTMQCYYVGMFNIKYIKKSFKDLDTKKSGELNKNDFRRIVDQQIDQRYYQLVKQLR